MSIWIAMLLGFVQGVCEFLPVSSSGHLLLLQKIFGITEGAMFFSVMLHIGTLVAVCIVYRQLLWKLIRRPFCKTVGLLILSLVPTVLLALLMKKVEPFKTFYDNAEQGAYLGFCFLITSVLLLLSDRIRLPKSRQRKMRDMRITDALIIGGMQGIGVLPGVSRSGSTISGALFAGLTRKAAADFSFLMSIPSILGGALLETMDLLEEAKLLGGDGGIGAGLSAALGGIHWTAILAGMAVAGITGYFAIRLMLAAIKKNKLWGFAIYTAVLGVLVLIDTYGTRFFF